MKIVCWNRYVIDSSLRVEIRVEKIKQIYVNLNLFKVTGKKNRMKKKKLLKEIIAQIENWNKCIQIYSNLK